MKIDPLAMPTSPLGGPREVDPTDEKAKAAAIGGKTPIDPEKLRLAREFEQIFLRKMLSSLEKSGKTTGGAGASSSGGDAYGSMIVSALAQAVSQGGGLGLADMIARSATDQAKIQSAQKAHNAEGAAGTTAPSPLTGPLSDPNAHGPVAMPPVGVTYRRPAPAQIVNENIDMQEMLKDRKP